MMLRRFLPLKSRRPEHWTELSGANPNEPIGQVIFSVLTSYQWHGKVRAELFFPAFCAELRSNGFAVYFCRSLSEIEYLMASGLVTILVHVFPEDKRQIASKKVFEVESRCLAVYNSASTGLVIGDKAKTAEIFRYNGILTPEFPDASDTVFSNARYGSNKKAKRIEAGAKINRARFNTRFIDTSVEFMGRCYFTSVRLVCVNDALIHAFPRARGVDEGNPSVHASNTPLNPALIEFLQSEIVNPYWDVLGRLGRDLARALGRGFYVHDLLIERSSHRIYVCESGFKLEPTAFWTRVESISDSLPSQSILFPIDAYAKHVGSVFSQQCKILIEERPAY